MKIDHTRYTGDDLTTYQLLDNTNSTFALPLTYQPVQHPNRAMTPRRRRGWARVLPMMASQSRDGTSRLALVGYRLDIAPN